MNSYTAEQAHAAARRGAAWMDKHCPNWVDEIDLTRLALEDSSACVLGQTTTCLLPDFEQFPDWRPYYTEVVAAFWPTSGNATATTLGFNVPEHYRQAGDHAAYEMLTIAWKELIGKRLKAHP